MTRQAASAAARNRTDDQVRRTSHVLSRAARSGLVLDLDDSLDHLGRPCLHSTHRPRRETRRSEPPLIARRTQSRRARLRSRRHVSQDATSRPTRALGAKARRRYRPRPVPDRRRFPREWGRSMAARRAGYARQRQARAAGICATDAANAARREKRAEQERRQSAASRSVAYTAPVVASAVERGPENACTPRSSYPTAALPLSAAWRSLAPIGRAERLAESRNRR